MADIEKPKDIWGNVIEENAEEGINVNASKTIPPISRVNKLKEDKKSMVLQIIDGKIVEREMTEEEKNIKYDEKIDVNTIENFDKFKKSLTSDNPHKESNEKMLDFVEKMKAKGYEMTINMIGDRIASVDILTPDLNKFQQDFEEVTGYKFEEKEENKEESKNNSKEAAIEVENAEKEVEKAKEELDKANEYPANKDRINDANADLDKKTTFVEKLLAQKNQEQVRGAIR
jgi:hypothetical protein